MGIPVPIGNGRGGLVVLDLATAPHLLVGGTPGFGKSAFLHICQHFPVEVLPFRKCYFGDTNHVFAGE